MTKWMQWTLLLVIAFGAVGCVAQATADEQSRLLRTKDDQIANLQSRIEELESRLAAIRAGEDDNAALRAQLEDALAKNRQHLADLQALREQIAGLPMEIGRLDPQIDAALQELAASNPGLMTYDAKRGMIQFASDLTFALGKADVNPAAVSSLRQLAQIINTNVAQQYDVRVVGHTDSVPVKNAANVQRFGDNWGLSAARAISVMREMQNAGVSPQRLIVAGRGQYQPVAQDDPRTGNRLNRRVEIFLVPAGAPAAPRQTTTPAENPSTPAPSTPRTPAPAQPDQPEMFK